MYYYWLDTDFHYGDFNEPKFALFRIDMPDGVKDKETEQLILWSAYSDLDGYDEAEAAEDYEGACRIIDDYITNSIGFLPDYEVN